MANNVEDFLIRFVFEDKQAVKQLKSISSKYDNLTTRSKKHAKQERQASKKKQSDNKKEIDQIKKKKNLLRDQIRIAEKLGINTKGFKQTLSRARKETTLDSRRLELQELISKERLDQQARAMKQLEIEKRATLEKQKQMELARREKIDFQKASKMDRFSGSKAFRDLNSMNQSAATDLYRKAQKALNRETYAGERQFREYERELRRTAAGMRKARRDAINLTTAQQGLKDSVRNSIRAYASLFALMEGTTAINRVGQDFEGMRASMLASSGGAVQAGKDLAFVRGEAVRLGLDLRDATDNFVKFQFAAKETMSQADTRALFTGFSEFATALQLTPARYEKALTALQQMMNKEQVMAEELKNQLGEQAAGSIQVFARALNVSTRELFAMMERGELMASEVLPMVAKEFSRTAREGGALAKAIETARIQQRRFTTGAQESADVIFQGGFGEGISNMFKELTDSLGESTKGMEGLGKVYKLFFDLVTQGAKIAIPILDSLFFVLGEISDVLNAIFVNDSTVTLAGIAAVTLAIKNLDRVFKSLYARLFLTLGILDEIFSFFVAGRIGVLEKLMGTDVALGDTAFFQSLKDWFEGGEDATLLEKLLKGFAGLATAYGIWKGSMWGLQKAATAASKALWNVATGGMSGGRGTKGGKGGATRTPKGTRVLPKAALATTGLVGGIGAALWFMHEQNVGRIQKGESLVGKYSSTKELLPRYDSEALKRDIENARRLRNERMNGGGGIQRQENHFNIKSDSPEEVRREVQSYLEDTWLQNTVGGS
ncbi:MAG: hypothetical protein GOVbin4162_30 [Prokaryotic dsDNA virus sp.]|nr:MAG: hypothetical protein GOVbin4162_30 [Prokaryotic dsDNA virus sp.]